MATILVDGKPYQVKAEENLLHACLSARLQSALFLLASGAGIRRRLPPMRGQAVQGRARPTRTSSWPA